jgi:DNA-binding NtrC family response regulator
MANILFVDDDPDFTAAVQPLLQAENHSVQVAGTLQEAGEALERGAFDILFVDLLLPDGSGLDLVRDGGPKAVIITGHPSIESAIRAVRGPVVDYLVKPLDKSQLLDSIAAACRADDSPPASNRGAADLADLGEHLIGQSPAMHDLQGRIRDYGVTDVTVLVTGESGTGKELVARALHHARGGDGSFVALNCGAIPRDLLASELFGHEKGSFTGAAARRKGVFERAGSGTVFLDEIGELPLQQQTSLLRVLETRTVQRLGAEKETPVSSRVVAATNSDLEKDVSDGKFREDLYYRLNVLSIHVPPLRDRGGDIELLARHFLSRYATEHGTPAEFSAEALARLSAYFWPGNVRELKHTVLKAALLNRGNKQVEKLPDDFERPPAWTSSASGLQPGMSIRDVEKNLIEKTLDHFGGNKKRTAEALGISLKTLYNRLRDYEDSSAGG